MGSPLLQQVPPARPAALPRLVALALVLAFSACGDDEPPVVPLSGRTCSGDSALYIVSHQDDDLLFMNPDILHDIRAGMNVRTVYLTAGDAGHDEKYWREREVGIQAAYARMAGVGDVWRPGIELVSDKRLHVLTLRKAPRVSVAFLRLPDGHLRGGGFRSTGNASLEKLWKGEVASLASVDGESHYSRAELIDVLAKLMTSTDADCVGTLDSSDMYGWDHSDHRHSAKFAFEAHRAYSRPHLFSQYRGYNIRGEPVNLSSGSRDMKWEVFSTYALHDEHVCRSGGTDCLSRSQYPHFVWRQYAVTALQNLEGSLTGLAGRCLGTPEGPSAHGTPVLLRDCVDAPRQRWALLYNGQLRGPDGQCLEPRDGNPARGTPVQLGDCADVPHQKWTLLGNGQLRGPEGRCLEVRDGSSADGTPVQLGDCADVPRQLWTPRFGAVSSWASGLALPVLPVGLTSTPRTASDFRLADVNGDGLVDGCMRLAEGLSCALNTGSGSFGPLRLYLAGGSGSFQLADLNHDGKADVCEPGPEGLSCALADESGTGFGEIRSWSSDLSGAAGPGGPLLADINGDGYADACERSAEGLRCALNDTVGHFAPATVWLDLEGTEALAGSWPGDFRTMLLLGDVNHDGRADVCGRSDQGVRCALANPTGTGFEDLHLWSYRADFSDADGWGTPEAAGSLRLADLNGDGFADVCGRRAEGLFCALSVGSRFLRIQAFQPGDFTDAQGWGLEGCGTSLQFGDLDRDGHADVCGWGVSGVVCALAPGAPNLGPFGVGRVQTR